MSKHLTPEEQAALTKLKARQESWSKPSEERVPWYSYDGFARWAGDLLWAMCGLLTRYFVFWVLLFFTLLIVLLIWSK